MIIGLRIMQDATIMPTPASSSPRETRTTNPASSMSSGSSSKVDDSMAYEYSVGFDAGSPEFKVLQGGTEFCGGVFSNSTLMEMVPASCKDLFESWVCEEVQGAPDHRQVLSKTSLCNLPMHAKIRILADRAWLDIPCPNELSSADLPVTLRLQGIRPLHDEASVAPRAFERKQQSSPHSRLQQVLEKNRDSEVQSLPARPAGEADSDPQEGSSDFQGSSARRRKCQSLPGEGDRISGLLRSRSISRERKRTCD